MTAPSLPSNLPWQSPCFSIADCFEPFAIARLSCAQAEVAAEVAARAAADQRCAAAEEAAAQVTHIDGPGCRF